MGALHAGHLRLVQQAREECDCVAVSIFVNPTQFGPSEDFALYPRTFETDLQQCRDAGVDLIFAPPHEEMYPRPQYAWVDVARITDHLCGPFRPGHFRGVATVVLKLLNIIQPDYAYFGEKDAQQLAVIRRMVSDLNIPVSIIGVPTVREPDGLALSSRNARLTPSQRAMAIALYRALSTAAEQIISGVREAAAAKRPALALLQSCPEVRFEYLEIVDPEEMQPVEEITGTVRIAGAIWLDGTRLIDNVLVHLPGEP
jgi:pantoate--beta-alanine ligase